jgi:hypothetical protein
MCGSVNKLIDSEWPIIQRFAIPEDVKANALIGLGDRSASQGE